MNTNHKLVTTFYKFNVTMRRIIDPELEKLGVCRSEYLILHDLWHVESRSIDELSYELHFVRETIQESVKALEKRRLIKEVNGSYTMTSTGRSFFDDIDAEHQKFIDELLSDFSEADKKDFIERMSYFQRVVAKVNK